MTALLSLPVFDSSYANCEACELLPQLERGHFCCAYRPEKFNGVMIIGEGPGQQEVSAGRPFVGISGQLLRTLLDDVGLNLDECFVTNCTLCVEGTTQVRLADGSLDRIDMIVKHRKKVLVQTTNGDGSIGSAAVVDWFRNRRGDRALVRVGFRHGKRAGLKGHVRAIVTEDHPVRTPTGWVAAGRLRNGDLIGTDQYAPIGTSLEIALGTIVGDGCIARSTLIVKHGVKQTQWSDCKKRALSTLGVKQIELSKIKQVGFSTHTSAFWRAMYEKFYVLDEDGKRRIPRDFIDTLTPLSLAVWFLDDGHLAMRGAGGRRPCASLSTVSYNRSDVEYLAAKLSTRGLKCSVSAKGVVLFSVVGTVALSAYIRTYVPPTMQYKLLPADRNRFANATYEPMRATTFFDAAVVEVASPRGENPDQPVYCLEINGTHNFATPGAVLHNCKPPPKDKALHEAMPSAIPSCLGRLEAEIAAVRPRIIVALGAAAWIAVSGYDVQKTKTAPFDCDDLRCSPLTRKVGPVIQCAGAVAIGDGSTSAKCGHLHFFKTEPPSADEIDEVRATPCPKCSAARKKLRPKMIKCPTCGGRKRRNTEYTVFDWDYNITAAAGAIFEPAKVGEERKDHELDAWLGEQGVQYIVPTYHPDFVLRGQQFMAKTVQKHLRKVVRLLSGATVAEVNYAGTKDPKAVRDFCWAWSRDGLAEVPLFTIDIETEAIVYNDAGEAQALDARTIRNVTKIKCIGISTLGRTLVVDTRDVDPSDSSDDLLNALYNFLTDNKIPKAYHNGAGYDIPVIDLIWGVPWDEQVRSAKDDSQYAHINLYPDEPHRLDHVTFECADVHAWKPARTVKGVQVHKDYAELELYNARDAWHTALNVDHFGVRNGLAIPGGRMDRAGLAQVYGVDSRIRQIAVGMTMAGMPLNYRKFREVGEHSRQLIADADHSIRRALTEAGHPASNEVNFNSVPQLTALMFGRDSFFKLAAVDMTSPTQPATSKTHFQKLLSTTDNPHALKALNGLIELRKQKYVASNFVFAEDMQPWGDGRVHAIWQSWGAKTGRFTSSPNCFDGETELLTPQGWVRFDGIDPTQHTMIAQYTDTGAIEFVEPTQWIRKHFRGEMVSLQNVHTRLLLTPDHDCLLRQRRTDALKVFKAEAYPEDWLQLHAGHYDGGHLHLSDAEIALLCATQADGHFVGKLVDFKFSKPRKIDRFRWLVRELFGEHSAEVYDRDYVHGGKSGTRFSFNRGRVPARFIDEHKHFTWALLELDASSRKRLCAELQLWDGHTYARNTGAWTYSSSIESNVDIVQALASLSGIRAKKRVYLGSKSPNYQIDATPLDYSMTTNIERESVPWDDFVYCVSVPSSHVVVRREGRVCITNQCQNIPIWLREAFEAPEGRVIVSADGDQIELRMIGWLSGDPELIKRTLNANKKRKLEPEHDPHAYIASIAFSQFTKLSLNDPTHGTSSSGQQIKKCLCETCKRNALRDLVKRVIYGLNYGAGAFTVLEAIYNGGYEGPPITIAMVEHVKVTVFKEYSHIPTYRDELVKQARIDGAIYSPLMKRRRIFPLTGFPGIEIPVTEVYNYPVQSGAADVINEAFILFDDGLRSIDPTARIIAQVHDAIYTECAEDKGEAVKKLLVQCMTMSKVLNGITMDFSASGKIGKTMKS